MFRKDNYRTFKVETCSGDCVCECGNKRFALDNWTPTHSSKSLMFVSWSFNVICTNCGEYQLFSQDEWSTLRYFDYIEPKTLNKKENDFTLPKSPFVPIRQEVDKPIKLILEGDETEISLEQPLDKYIEKIENMTDEEFEYRDRYAERLAKQIVVDTEGGENKSFKTINEMKDYIGRVTSEEIRRAWVKTINKSWESSVENMSINECEMEYRRIRNNHSISANELHYKKSILQSRIDKLKMEASQRLYDYEELKQIKYDYGTIVSHGAYPVDIDFEKQLEECIKSKQEEEMRKTNLRIKNNIKFNLYVLSKGKIVDLKKENIPSDKFNLEFNNKTGKMNIVSRGDINFNQYMKSNTITIDQVMITCDLNSKTLCYITDLSESFKIGIGTLTTITKNCRFEISEEDYMLVVEPEEAWIECENAIEAILKLLDGFEIRSSAPIDSKDPLYYYYTSKESAKSLLKTISGIEDKKLSDIYINSDWYYLKK